VQPAILSDTDILFGSPFWKGTRRLHVEKQGSTWQVEEVWTSRAISPYFNDLVIEGNHLYGFGTGVFSCVSLDDGKIKWRERGYGAGQVLLLADQNLLLVLSETGAVALLEANPNQHREIARFQALKGEGKTWNHPVVAHGRLYVRNSEEAACYQLTEIGARK
jgi:outer membrane protein assembly factor BamB